MEAILLDFLSLCSELWAANGILSVWVSFTVTELYVFLFVSIFIRLQIGFYYEIRSGVIGFPYFCQYPLRKLIQLRLWCILVNSDDRPIKSTLLLLWVSYCAVVCIYKAMHWAFQIFKQISAICDWDWMNYIITFLDQSKSRAEFVDNDEYYWIILILILLKETKRLKSISFGVFAIVINLALDEHQNSPYLLFNPAHQFWTNGFSHWLDDSHNSVEEQILNVSWNPFPFDSYRSTDLVWARLSMGKWTAKSYLPCIGRL